MKASPQMKPKQRDIFKDPREGDTWEYGGKPRETMKCGKKLGVWCVDAKAWASFPYSWYRANINGVTNIVRVEDRKPKKPKPKPSPLAELKRLVKEMQAVIDLAEGAK